MTFPGKERIGVDMKKVLARAALHAALSAVASLIIVSAYLWATFGMVGSSALMLAILCPIVIALPLSFFGILQKQRLSDALADLKAAHEELADTHMRLAEAHAARPPGSTDHGASPDAADDGHPRDGRAVRVLP